MFCYCYLIKTSRIFSLISADYTCIFIELLDYNDLSNNGVFDERFVFKIVLLACWADQLEMCPDYIGIKEKLQ